MEKDLIVAKKLLRKQIINDRLTLTHEEVATKSLKITEKVLELEYYQRAKSILLYIDFRNEAKTEFLIRNALSEGKRVFVPVTDVPKRKLYPTEIKEYPGDLVKDTFGVLIPKSGYVANPEEIDLVIVPGVGFDEKCNRLGYGGGFYDRFLLCTKKGTYFVAIAYELQIKNNVYAEEHDQPVHYVITEERVITNINV